MMDVLINNAYRILGLTVMATKREIVRRAEEIQTFIAIGQPLHYEADLDWIGDLHRNEETVKKALQALENSTTKVKHLLSWFWVIDEYDELAIDALSNKNVDRAVEVWSGAVHQKDSHYKKNLATLEQILALHESDSDYQHLKNSINYWVDLKSTTRLLNLIVKIDPELSKNLTDADLTNFVGRHLSRTAIPFLERWSNERQPDKISNFWGTLNDSELPTKIISHITEEYIKPLSEKIDRMCDEFSGMDDDYEKTYSQTKTFYEKVNPYFEQVKQTGDWFLIEKYGDKIGSIILNRAIHYGNNTDQWQKSKELCELAETVIIGSLLKDKLNKNLEVISHNLEQEKVWGDLKTIERAPSLGTVNGIGTTLYGRSNYDPESGSYEATKYFVFFMIPIFPLSRYRVIQLEDNYYRFLAKVPFRSFDKWHLGLALLAIVLCLVYGVGTTDSKRSPRIPRKPRPVDRPAERVNENETLPSIV